MEKLPPGGVIFTAIVDGKDELVPPAHRLPGVDYICFSDDPDLRSEGWRVTTVGWRDTDPTRTAKRVKILAHEVLADYSWSLWIDGNVRIRADITELITEHLAAGSFFVFRHEKRSCLYSEAEACMIQEKDDPLLIGTQISKYALQGMPKDFGLATNHILLRRHTDTTVKALMERWWDEISRWSRRDQLSLPYLLWRDASDFDFFFGGHKPFWHRRPFFQKVPHLKQQSAHWNSSLNLFNR